MKICPKCNSYAPDVAVFCAKCGSRIEAEENKSKLKFSSGTFLRPDRSEASVGDASGTTVRDDSTKLKISSSYKVYDERTVRSDSSFVFSSGYDKADKDTYSAESTVTDDSGLIFPLEVSSDIVNKDEVSKESETEEKCYIAPPAGSKTFATFVTMAISLVILLFGAIYFISTVTGPGEAVDILEDAINGDHYKMSQIVDPYCLTDKSEYETNKISELYVQRSKAIRSINDNSDVKLELLSYSKVDDDKFAHLSDLYAKKGLCLQEAYNCRVRINMSSLGKTYDMNDMDCIVRINDHWYPCMIGDNAE